MATTTTRLSAGLYEMTTANGTVVIARNPELAGPDKWYAYAAWDRYIVTDPLPTCAEAQRIATLILADRAAELGA